MRILRILTFVCLVSLVILGLAIPSTSLAAGVPVVQVVMFWMNGCPHCHYVLEEVLPPLQKQYGQQLEIILIELTDVESVNLFYDIAAAFGMSKEEVGVPFLVIGDYVLKGSAQIPAELPGLIDAYLQKGGVGVPDVPGMAAWLPASTQDLSVSQELNPLASGDFSLAAAVTVGMVAALAYSGGFFLRASDGKVRSKRSKERTGWQEWVIPILSLIGLGVAGYLSFIETQSVEAICGPVGDCNAVQSSPYAFLFGFLPVGVLGLFGYAAILSTWYLRRFHPHLMEPYDSPLIFGMAFIGTLFSLYLTLLEIFAIQAICLWCLSSAVIMTALMLASLEPARRSLKEIDWKAASV